MNNNIIVTLKSSTTEMNLNSHEEGIYLIPDLEGLTSIPEIRTSSGVNAGADGGWTSAQFFDARSIAMKVVISNEDVSVVEQKRQALNSLLAQGRKEDLLLTVVTEAGNAYTVYVRPTSVSSALNQVLKAQEMLIQFRADDPLIYGEGSSGGEEAILHVQQALGGFAIPFKFPLAIGGGSGATTITNSGSESVYPIITLEGPLHSPTVINRTTNQQIQVLVDLANIINWAGEETAQGTYINITNSLDIPAALSEVEIQGNSVQSGTPTPDAPIPVQTTTGENDVEIVGKNIMPTTNGSYTSQGLTYSVSDGVITVNNTSTAVSTCDLTATYPINLKAGQSYTISMNNPVGSGSSSVSLRLMDKNSNPLTGTTVNANTGANASVSFTPSADVFGLRGQVRVASGVSLTNFVIKPQLELGSTATEYEPYQRQTKTVNLGKNLFNFPESRTFSVQSMVISTTAGESSFTINGTNSGSAVAAQIVRVDVPLKLDSGTYTLKIVGLNQHTTSTDRCYIAKATSVGTPIATCQPNNDWTKSFTLNEDSEMAVQLVFEASTSYSNKTITIQLERGTQATTYAPYFTPIELCKIGDYQDKIYKSADKWYLHKEIGKVVLDGTENWTTSLGSGGQIRYFVLNASNAALVPSNLVSPLMSNYYTSEKRDDLYNLRLDFGATLHSTRSELDIRNKDITTTADFKTWLSTHPTTVYYALATPTDTEITNTALIAQLNALMEAQLYVGTNNVSTSSEYMPAILDISFFTEYTRSIDKVVIDSQLQTVTLNGLDIYHQLSESSEFITIAPGENEMVLTSTNTSDEGIATIKFKQGYLSI